MSPASSEGRLVKIMSAIVRGDVWTREATRLERVVVLVAGEDVFLGGVVLTCNRRSSTG
jgi:hypothetical protein